VGGERGRGEGVESKKKWVEMYGGQNNAAQAEAILVWLQQEMGYTAVPSAEALGKICRGNMIPVWKFLVERVKAEKTVEEIRRNIHVHGSSISTTTAAASAGVGVGGVSSRKEESQEDRPKSQERPRTPKGERESSSREGTTTHGPKTPVRERRVRDGKGRARMVPPSSREMGTTDKDKEMERMLPEPEDSKEKILREREAAASEVARMRQTIDRLLKDIKSRMLDLSKEEAERQRVQDEKSNLRLVMQASAALHLLEARKECSSRWVC